MMFRIFSVVFIAFASMTPAHAHDMTGDEVKRLALEAIVENPEIIMEAVAILQEREQQAERDNAVAALDQNRDLLEQDPNAPVMGNPDGDVIIVEFFDYNCGYCRRAAPGMQALLETDKNVKVVYREWPILGEGSVFASRASLASRKQGMYTEFHWAMMGLQGRLNESSIMQIAANLGMDLDQLRADMNAPEVDAHFAQSTRLAQAMGFTGTPSFIIGDTVAPGFVDPQQLASIVASARNGG